METIELNGVSKFFGSVIALKNISTSVNSGEVLCLLGDNGAGKSTLIKTISGVYRQDEGQLLLEGKELRFDSPRDALDCGIATVYQDLALVPLMSVTRNFFMGREPQKSWGPFSIFDTKLAEISNILSGYYAIRYNPEPGIVAPQTDENEPKND